MIRVVVADDQAMIRAGLRLILESEDDITVVGEAGDGREALAVVARVRPDLVLMDLRMPLMSGVEAIGQLPESAKVLVLTTFHDDSLVHDSLRAGASGYLLKTAPPEQLVSAVRAVVAGQALLDPIVTRRLIDRAIAGPRPEHRRRLLAHLTEREIEIVTAVGRGQTNAEIAAATRLTEATVKTYLGRVLAKTGRRDRAQVVVLAYEAELVRPGQP